MVADFYGPLEDVKLMKMNNELASDVSTTLMTSRNEELRFKQQKT